MSFRSAVSWLRGLDRGFSPRGPGLYPRPACVGCMMDTVALGQLPLLFSLITIIPSLLCICISLTYDRHIMLATESVVKQHTTDFRAHSLLYFIFFFQFFRNSILVCYEFSLSLYNLSFLYLFTHEKVCL